MTAQSDSGGGGLFAAIRRYRQTSGQQVSFRRNNLLGYLFIAPAMALYLTFNVWPIFRGIAMAFTDYRFVYPDTRWDFNGFSNFIKMVGDRRAMDAAAVSLKYLVFVAPAMILIALVLAVLISKVKRGAAFYRWVVYLPAVLPVAVIFLMFGEMYGFQFGFINTVLRDWGIENPPNWLGDRDLALPSIGAAHIWMIFGFPTLLFLIGIYNIGSEMYEAASLDGANGWHQFLYLTAPLLKPTFALIVVLNLPLFGVVEPMLILNNGGPANSTRTLGLYLYQQAFEVGDLRLGYAAAISLVIGLISALIAGLIFRWSRQD